MIFVDTSIWIEFFKNPESKISQHLQDILIQDLVGLIGIVKLEILNGAGKKNFTKLHELLSAIPEFHPNQKSFQNIEKNIQKSVYSGYSFGVADLMIAQIAFENQSPLWTLDSDFQNMEKLGFLELYKISIS